MKIQIDRSKWLRGEGSEPSRLLRPSDGKLCCIGQISLACGVPSERLGNIGTVARVLDLPIELEFLVVAPHPQLSPLRKENSRIGKKIMEINDSTTDSAEEEEEKEEELKNLFALHGIELEFIN